MRKEQFYKKLDLFVVVIILFLSFQINAQSEEDLFSMIVEKDKSELPLLPERMVFTQRLLWGNKGLLRQSKIVPLSRQMREKELKVRRIMLKTHQIIGYTTLLAMIAQGFIGGKLYNGDNSLYNTHKTMGKIVNIGYFSGAGMSLFAPPPLINKKVRGLNSIKAHKILATIHFSAMLSTNYFSDRDRGAHKASAYTLFGSYTAAVLVFKF
ncbi:hypothetical protein N9T93_00240 [Flavobacteriaceae bacterium]|nr:hypothetical protein [Flavobacteriaceae bacterium]